MLAISSKLASKLEVNENSVVEVNQGKNTGKFKVAITDELSETTVLLAANVNTCGFSGRYDSIEIKLI